MVSTDKGLQLFHSRMVGCHLLSWRNLQKKIAFFRLFSSERSETCDTPKGIYFSELKNLGGGGVRDSPCAYASCIYFPCVYGCERKCIHALHYVFGIERKYFLIYLILDILYLMRALCALLSISYDGLGAFSPC